MCPILICVFPVDHMRYAPARRTMLFPSPVVPVIGNVDSKADTVSQQQNEDSTGAVLTKPNIERVIHHTAEVGNQPRQSLAQIGGDEQSKPNNRNNAAEVKNDICP